MHIVCMEHDGQVHLLESWSLAVVASNLKFDSQSLRLSRCGLASSDFATLMRRSSSQHSAFSERDMLTLHGSDFGTPCFGNVGSDAFSLSAKHV